MEDVETQLASAVNVGVEHGRDELDAWGLVGICLFELHHQAEGAIFERSVGWANDDSVPELDLESLADEGAKRHLPGHDIVSNRRGTNTCGRIGLHALRIGQLSTRTSVKLCSCPRHGASRAEELYLEIAHQAATSGGRHDEDRVIVEGGGYGP